MVTLRHDVAIGENAALTLIEVAANIGGAGGQANGFSTISIANGGQLDHVKVGGGEALTDLATWRANLGAEAAYRAVQMIPGAPLARNQVFVTFEGENAELDFASAVLGNGTNHIDSTIVVGASRTRLH